MPRVTVITVCHNYGRFLGGCLESVQAQTFHEFEHIVVNCGSTDNTSDVIARYPVRALSMPVFGRCTSRNFAVAHASTDYVMNLDADDKIAPSYLAEVMALAAPHTLVSTGLKHWTTSGLHGSEFPPADLKPADMCKRNRLFNCTLFPRQDFLDVGCYDEALDHIGYEDWNLWTKLLKAGCQVRVVPELLFFYRDHPESLLHKTPPSSLEIVRAMNAAFVPTVTYAA